MSFLRRVGLIPERIWPLQLGPWSFGVAQEDQPTRAAGALDEDKAVPTGGGKAASADERSISHLPQRLLLLGCAIILQSYFEIPSQLIRAVLSQSEAAALSFLIMTASLTCICLAVSIRLPGWVNGGKIGRALGWIALVGCLALSLVGVCQVGATVVASFRAPFYPNDGTLLNHNAAVLLLRGENPYVSSDIVAAIREYNQPAYYTTPLQQGKLAGQQDYPTDDQLRQLMAQEPAGHPDQVLEFESHLSYPALSFLVLVPLVWAGLPTVVPFYLLCLALLTVIGLRFARREMRWWIALLFLADAPVLNSMLAGDLDVFYILLVFLAWLWWERWWLSAVLLGVALASKQIAWFYLPFYLIFIYQRRGFRDAAGRLVISGLLFLAVNGPFILLNSSAWVTGVLAPVRDPMFPEGAGLIELAIGKLLPLLSQQVYTGLEGLGMAGALLLYFRWGRERPEAAMLLAVLPLFLAWRSLPTYFYFCALPAALLLALAPRQKIQETAESRIGLPKSDAQPVQLLLTGEVS